MSRGVAVMFMPQFVSVLYLYLSVFYSSLAGGCAPFLLNDQNHLILCFSLSCMHGVVPMICLISLFLSSSLLMMFSAFLRNVISRMGNPINTCIAFETT